MNKNFPLYSADGYSESYIAYRYRISTKSKVIYITALIVIIGAVSVLPLIYTQISIKSTGILSSDVEKAPLVTSISGKVIAMRMKDNQKLSPGDTLLVIDASLPKQQDAILQKRYLQLNQLLHDINKLLLLTADETEPISLNPKLQTGQYTASWQQFTQESEDRYNVKRQAERKLDRYDKLFENNVLTASEYEKYKFEHEQTLSAYSLVTKRYKSQWQLEATGYRNELNQLQGQQADIIEQEKLFTLTAPIGGSLQNLSGLQTGAYVFANQRIAEISPDSQLMAFCYIKPSDIGLIRQGQEVSFQVDAFNYNQWGLLTGTVVDISADILLVNGGQTMFKVKCSLDNNYLLLNNGYKGYLKKGMNFTAHFKITERSLFQLLYDKVDDWVNPNKI